MKLGLTVGYSRPELLLLGERGVQGAAALCDPARRLWEWLEEGGVKVRTRIDRPDGKPLLVAGVWNRVMTPDGPLESCPIVTRALIQNLEHMHDRMPALLLRMSGWTAHPFRRVPWP